jgi:hypothetical protein
VREQYRALLRGEPAAADPAAALVAVAAEVLGLCDRVDRLARLLAQARCAYANLAAAARAALSAQAEGESDPWWYLRDELGPDPVPPLEPGTGCGRCCR